MADYYPFGWLMPDRKQLQYRYGYQGQELDSVTNWHAFQLRMYDGRIGRWMSVDPYGEFHSPYLAMGNMPMILIDPTGGMTGGGGDCSDCPVYDVPGITVTASAASGWDAAARRISALYQLFRQYGFEGMNDAQRYDVLNYLNNRGNYAAYELRPLNRLEIQLASDVLGSTEIPVVSQIGDAASAGISVYDGDNLGALLSAGGMFIPWLSQTKGVRTVIRMARARALGKAGEKLAGIPEAYKKFAIYVGGRTRIPDHIDLDRNILTEAKNVAKQGWTAQLKDYAAYAQANGLTFILKVRPTTQLSGPLLDAQRKGLVRIEDWGGVVRKN